jgi:hypothetical protein
MYVQYGNDKVFHVEHFVDLAKTPPGTDEVARSPMF